MRRESRLSRRSVTCWLGCAASDVAPMSAVEWQQMECCAAPFIWNFCGSFGADASSFSRAEILKLLCINRSS